MQAPYQRHLAHIATTPASTKRGTNHFIRSERTKRKVFEKEARKLIKGFEARNPGFPKPATFEERESLCAAHPDFADFCKRMDALAAKWRQ